MSSPPDPITDKSTAALSAAILALSANLSLSETLRRIITAAAELIEARYAALGVPDEDGERLIEFVTIGLTPEEEARIPHRPRGEGILGVVMREGQSLRLRQITDHPRSAGFPAHHPPMTSFLGVPIKYHDQLWGMLYFTDKQGTAEFSDYDRWLIEMLATHAGVAIEHAQLYEQVQNLRVLEERQRIGMDLHDGVMQSIYAVGLNLELVTGLLGDDAPQASGRVRDAIEALNGVIRDIRSYILDLRPRRFEGDNLASGLQRLLVEFKANTLLAVEFRADDGADSTLSTEARVTLFHIAQEALSNAARHSRATRVEVRLLNRDHVFALSIKDNGQGFDTQSATRRIGHGLRNMQDRIRTTGGELQLLSVPGQGTEVRVTLPLAVNSR